MRAAHFREHPLIALERWSQQSRELTFGLHESREASDRRGAAERRKIVAAHGQIAISRHLLCRRVQLCGRPAERLCQLAVRVVFLPRVLVRQVERGLVELQQRRIAAASSPILAGRVACSASPLPHVG